MWWFGFTGFSFRSVLQVISATSLEYKFSIISGTTFLKRWMDMKNANRDRTCNELFALVENLNDNDDYDYDEQIPGEWRRASVCSFLLSLRMVFSCAARRTLFLWGFSREVPRKANRTLATYTHTLTLLSEICSGQHSWRRAISALLRESPNFQVRTDHHWRARALQTAGPQCCFTWSFERRK